MAEWSGVVNTTIHDFLKGASEMTLRKRLALAYLKSKGRISYGHDGDGVQWQVRMIEHALNSQGYGTQSDFAPLDMYKKANLDWRGYYMSDAMHEKERLMNRGAPALINRYAEIGKTLSKDFENKFAAELYVDGNAANNGNRMHGFDSFTGTSTTVVGDLIAKPDDSYGGLDTDLGGYGGSWTSAGTAPNASVATDWPNGTGSTEYDFWTPKLINWSSTSWGTGTNTFEANCERAIRQGLLWTTATSGKEGRPDVLLLGTSLYAAWANHWSAKGRIFHPHKESEDLGFGEVINFEGLGVTYEYDIPDANSAYGWNFDEVDLMCMYDQLFEVEGPEKEIRTQMWLMRLGMFGNMKFRAPKLQFKMKNYAAS